MSLLQNVTTQGKALPPRMVLYAGEKFGKSSFGAFAWKPIFVMTAAETGLVTLLESGRVPPTPHFPEDAKSWAELTRYLWAVRDEPHDYKTLVLDTGNGAENLCAAAVCEQHFGGDWTKYQDFGRGNERATKVWAEFLQLLDAIRTKRKMAILILQHARVKTFNNPAGDDWDQWRPESIDKLWALTHKWADAILFGGLKVNVNRKEEKATGGETRYLRTENTAAIVAGNRFGLPPEITSTPGAQNLWKAFEAAFMRSKAKPTAAPAPPPPAAAAGESGSERQPGEDDGDYPGDPEPGTE